MIIVVADTSPLNYLVLIAHIDLLFKLYGRIFIPSAVAEELSDPKAPQLVQKWIGNAPDWLETKFVPKVSDSLNYLGQGEREGITLAETLSAEMILIDDLPGRLEAESRKLTVRGTLGILAEAASRDLIVLSDALNSLRATNFYTAPALISRLLKEEQRRQRQ